MMARQVVITLTSSAADDYKLTWWQCYILNNSGQLTYICVSKLSHHWFGQWLVACLAPIHYLIQSWLIINQTIKSIFHWKFISSSKRYIEENAFENVGCQIGAILFWRQCVNTLRPRQDGRHFPDDIFKCIFLEWKCMNFAYDFTEMCSEGSN